MLPDACGLPPGPGRGVGGPGETILLWPLFKHTVMTKKKVVGGFAGLHAIYQAKAKNEEFRNFPNNRLKKTKSGFKPARPPL